MEITVHRPEELTSGLRAAWHRAMDESPEYANPLPGTGVRGRRRPVPERARVAVLRQGGGTGRLPSVRAGLFGAGRAIGLDCLTARPSVHRPGVTWDTPELLRACGLSVSSSTNLVCGQRPFESLRHLALFASPVIDVKPGDGTYPEWLRGTYSGLAKTTLKKRAPARPGRGRGAARVRRARPADAEHPHALEIRAVPQDRAHGPVPPGRGSSAWSTTCSASARSTSPGCRPCCTRATGRSPPTPAPGPAPYWPPGSPPTIPDSPAYSPGLMMHLRTARGGCPARGDLVDLGRGDKEYKDWLKTRELRVGEGFAAPPAPRGTGPPAVAAAGARPAEHGAGPPPAARAGRPAAADGGRLAAPAAR